MPHFMMTLKYSQNSIKALIANPSDRRKAAANAMAAVGATLKDFYFVFGASDAIVIYDAPDSVSAASLAMNLGASGAVSDIETSLLLTMEEAMDAMKKAGAAQGVYKPPS